MSIRATILDAIRQYNEKTKKPCSMAAFWDHIGGRVKGNRINQMLYSLREEKHLKATKMASRPAYYEYTITKAGLAYLNKMSSEIDTYDSIREWAGSAPSQTGSAKPTVRYSKSALSAIDSISEIVDKNERLLATIRSLHSQLGRILEAEDGRESNDELS